MTNREQSPQPFDEATRDMTSERRQVAATIVDQWMGAWELYAEASGNTDEPTVGQRSLVACTTINLADTVIFFDALTGSQEGANGRRIRDAITDRVASALSKTVRVGLPATPEAKRRMPNYDWSTHQGYQDYHDIEDLQDAVVIGHAIVRDALQGKTPSADIVNTMAERLGMAPPIRLKMGAGRRIRNYITDALERTGRELGNSADPDTDRFETMIGALEDATLMMESAKQVATLGSHLAAVEDDMPRRNMVTKSPTVRRLLKASHAQGNKLLGELFTNGFADPDEVLKQRDTLAELTDTLLQAQGISPDSAYVERLTRSQKSALGGSLELSEWGQHITGHASTAAHYVALKEIATAKQRFNDRLIVEEGIVPQAVETVETTSPPQPEPSTPVEVVGIPDDSAERIAGLREQLAGLEGELTELRSPYTATSGELKASGLRHLLHDLQLGTEDLDAGLVMNGITRTEAQRVAQMLYGLGGLYKAQGKEDQFRINTAHDLALEMQYVTAIHSVRNELVVLGQNGFGSLSTELCDTFNWIGQNKSTLQAIIARKLPQDALYYNHMLDELLDTSDRTAAIIEVHPPSEVDIVEKPYLPLDEEPEQFRESTISSEAEEIDLAPGIDGFIPLDESEVALQLDWEVFPAEVTLSDIQRTTRGAFRDSDAASIDWYRIGDLLEISRAYEGTLYRAKPRSLGATEPYFVVEATIHGKTFVIAENPQYGNATYVLRTDRAYDGASWQEILEQSREFARLLGAERVIHSEKRTHLERIMSNVQSQLLIKVSY